MPRSPQGGRDSRRGLTNVGGGDDSVVDLKVDSALGLVLGQGEGLIVLPSQAPLEAALVGLCAGLIQIQFDVVCHIDRVDRCGRLNTSVIIQSVR